VQNGTIVSGTAQGWRQLDPTLPPWQPQTWVNDKAGTRIDNAAPEGGFGGLRTHYTDAEKAAAGGHDLIAFGNGEVSQIDRGKAIAKAAAAVGGIVAGGLAIPGMIGGGAGPGAAGAGAGVGTGTAAAGASTPAWLKTALTLAGPIASRAAQGAAEGRIAQNQANVQQDTLAIARARLAAELMADKTTQTNRLNKQVVAGDVQHNLQPFHLTVPGVADSSAVGGFNASALGPNSREAGATLSQNALADLVSGKSVNDPNLKTPQATPQPSPSWVSKALGIIGPALSVGSLVAGAGGTPKGNVMIDPAMTTDPNDPLGFLKKGRPVNA
jgi:hypothetical protein